MKKESIHSQNKHIEFNGQFTDEIRRLLYKKRIELGLPYNLIAKYFGINWSTFRKWENGITRGCGLQHRPALESFINGELDEELKKRFSQRNGTYPQQVSSPVYQAMERLANTYTLCQIIPEVRDQFLDNLEHLTTDTLQKLVSQTQQSTKDSASKRTFGDYPKQQESPYGSPDKRDPPTSR